MFRSPRGRAPLAALLALLVLAPLAAATELPPYAPDATASRDRIPDIYKWDLTPLFPSHAAWEDALQALSAKVDRLRGYQGKLADPKAMRECLDLYFSLHNRATHVQQYASLSLNTNMTDQGRQADHQRALALMDEIMGAAGFIRGEILALDDATMEKAYAAEPGLEMYRRYLTDLRRRRSRVLSPDAERTLRLLGDNLWAEIDLNEIQSIPEKTFDALLTDISWPKVHDENGHEVQMTLSNYPVFRRSPKREVRAEAVRAFFGTLRRFQHAFTTTLAGQFQLDVDYARARGYDTALEAYLDKDNVDPAVFDNLISTINAHLEPLHRYVELRKKVMGYDDLHIYDLYVPMVKAAKVDIPYPEALRIVPEALQPLGTAYGTVLREGLDPKNGWVDVYPSRDKESGAFSASVYGRHPYVKMNYQNDLDDVFTLAHEFGHSLHSYLAMKNQAYPDFRYVPFLAEIASTCNEALLQDYLVAHAENKAERAALLGNDLENMRTTIYRQALFSEFERTVHGYVEDGVPVTAALLDSTYRGLVQRYYGPGFTVDPDDGMEWAYIPHFYYKYYMYTYATGLSCGLAIAERVETMGEPAAQAYLGMLKGGCSKPPLELLRGAGVDLTRPDAIEAALKRFDRTVTELAEVLGVKM